MRLVDDHQVGDRPPAPRERLRGYDLHGLTAVGHRVPTLHHSDADNPFLGEGSESLINQVDPGDDDRDRLSLAESAANDFGDKSGLAPACRQHEHRPTSPAPYMQAQFRDAALLMLP
jgi:hypothetical protein